MTIAMWLASKGVIPPKMFLHNPDLTNVKSETVFHILVKHLIIPPKEWFTKPDK